MQKHRQSGLTLLELLISIAIVTILATLTIANYQEYKMHAYYALSKQFARDLENAVIGVIAEGFLEENPGKSPDYGSTSGSSWVTDCLVSGPGFASSGIPNPLLDVFPYMCEPEFELIWNLAFNHWHAPIYGFAVEEGYYIQVQHKKAPRWYIIGARRNPDMRVRHTMETNPTFKVGYW